MAQGDNSETDGYAFITQTKGGKITVLSGGVIVNGGTIELPGGQRITIGSGQSAVIGGRRTYNTESPIRRKDHSVFRYKPQATEKDTESLSHPVSQEDMDCVSTHIGRHWKRLGAALGLSRGQLEAVEIDYHVEGHYEMSYQMLLKWTRQCAGRATVRELVHALCNIGKERLAEDLPVR